MDLNFGMKVKWKNFYVKFIGQGHRSKVRVTRSTILTSYSLGSAEEETQEYDWKEYDVACFKSLRLFCYKGTGHY